MSWSQNLQKFEQEMMRNIPYHCCISLSKALLQKAAIPLLASFTFHNVID